MLNGLFVHIPYRLLGLYLEEATERGLGLDLLLDAETLDTSRAEELEELGELIGGKGLGVSLHGPYVDLAPGSSDARIREVSLERLFQVVEPARLLGARQVVIHSGWDPWRWRYDGDQKLWAERSLEVWERLLEATEGPGTVWALENVFEEEPGPLRKIIDRIGSLRFRHCLDLGHWNVFARCSLEDWLSALGPFVVAVHLHDNDGGRDGHLALGQGNIDWKRTFDAILALPERVAMILEGASREAVEGSLSFMKELALGNSFLL